MKRHMMERLIQWKEEPNRKPLILKGVRQVGKTYLLKEFGKLHFPNYHYLNFEKEPSLAHIFEPDLNPKRILAELSFHLGKTIDLKKDLVIFDEIQECPKALTSLKYFQEDCPELYLCSAGSLLGLHLSSTPFPVGKVTFEILRPLSFEEFLLAIEDKSLPIFKEALTKNSLPQIVHDHLWNMLKHYFIVGGLPEAVLTYCVHRKTLFEAFLNVRKKQEDLLNSYYADIAKHAGKFNAMHIDRVLRAIPEQLQQTLDGSISKFKFKGVVPGISHYDRLVGAIDWLEAAGLAIKISIVNNGNLPFKAYSKENCFKLLLFDVGMLGSMSGLSAKTILDYDYGSYKGFFAENFVAQELLSAGEKELFSWQEPKAELEFLIESMGQAIPIEVKSGFNIKAARLKAFSAKYQPNLKIILSGRPLEIDHAHSTCYCPLYLTSYLPKIMESNR